MIYLPYNSAAKIQNNTLSKEINCQKLIFSKEINRSFLIKSKQKPCSKKMYLCTPKNCSRNEDISGPFPHPLPVGEGRQAESLLPDQGAVEAARPLSGGALQPSHPCGGDAGTDPLLP
jgi:hypothetical protein